MAELTASAEILRHSRIASHNGVTTLSFNENEALGHTAAESAAVKPVKPEPAQAETAPYKWILSPAIDLLFSCGGLLWIFFGLHFFIVGPQSRGGVAQALVVLVILATHLLSETHNVATLKRIYKDQDETDKKKFAFYTGKLASWCMVLAAFSMIFSFPSLLTKIYLIWVAQHFTAQTYGLALLYCFKNGYQLGNFEKKVFSMLMQATAMFAIVRQLTFFEWGGGQFLGLDIPFWGPLPAVFFIACSLVLALLCLLFAGIILKKRIVQKQWFPLPAFLLTLTGILIWVFGQQVTGTLWLYVPAFYHGSQYLVISTAFYLKERGLPESVPANKIATTLMQPPALKYFASLALLGSCIYIAIPRVLEQVGVPFEISFASIFCAVNFHHFLTDAAIWKLRDSRTREILVA